LMPNILVIRVSNTRVSFLPGPGKLIPYEEARAG
jgi:hypothetical protein